MHFFNTSRLCPCRGLLSLVLLQIRSIDYMQTKVKQPSSKAIYRLVGMDLFGTDTKAHHVSRIFQLPHTGVHLGSEFAPASPVD